MRKRCEDCERPITDSDRRAYQRESGDIGYYAPLDPDGSWPRICDDCAGFKPLYEGEEPPWKLTELERLIEEQKEDTT